MRKRWAHTREGFSLIEIILGAGLILVALVAFLSISSSSTQQALQSRNQTVAIVLANTLFDEVLAHQEHYGEPPPQDWSATVHHPVQAWVEGQAQEMDFHAMVNTTNGSFTDSTKNLNYDDVKITVSWHEGPGNTEPGAVDPKDNKVYTVRVAVWRP